MTTNTLIWRPPNLESLINTRIDDIIARRTCGRVYDKPFDMRYPSRNKKVWTLPPETRLTILSGQE